MEARKWAKERVVLTQFSITEYRVTAILMQAMKRVFLYTVVASLPKPLSMKKQAERKKQTQPHEPSGHKLFFFFFMFCVGGSKAGLSVGGGKGVEDSHIEHCPFCVSTPESVG